jgi:hypothetical protein
VDAVNAYSKKAMFRFSPDGSRLLSVPLDSGLEE